MDLRRVNAFLAPVFRAVGVEVSRYKSTVAGSRPGILRDAGVDVVLDVGANAGEYAAALRRGGYRNRIVSLEPLPQVFRYLEKRAAGDPGWDCLPYAAGDVDRRMIMQLAENIVSSSLAPILEQHVAVAPDSATKGTAEVPVRRIDSLDELLRPGERVALKLDVQGYEAQALEGCEGIMDRVVVAEVELSTAPLYEGQALAHEVMARLYEHGFELVNIQRGLLGPTGRVLQFDGLFLRANSSRPPPKRGSTSLGATL